jgi:hypothetical protein
MEQLARRIDALARAIENGGPIDSLCNTAVELYGGIQELQGEHCDPDNPLDVIPLPTEVRAAVEHWLELCQPLLHRSHRSPNSGAGRAFRESLEELSELIEADDELNTQPTRARDLAARDFGF